MTLTPGVAPRVDEDSAELRTGHLRLPKRAESRQSAIERIARQLFGFCRGASQAGGQREQTWCQLTNQSLLCRAIAAGGSSNEFRFQDRRFRRIPSSLVSSLPTETIAETGR